MSRASMGARATITTASTPIPSTNHNHVLEVGCGRPPCPKYTVRVCTIRIGRLGGLPPPRRTECARFLIHSGMKMVVTDRPIEQIIPPAPADIQGHTHTTLFPDSPFVRFEVPRIIGRNDMATVRPPKNSLARRIMFAIDPGMILGIAFYWLVSYHLRFHFAGGFFPRHAIHLPLNLPAPFHQLFCCHRIPP